VKTEPDAGRSRNPLGQNYFASGGPFETFFPDKEPHDALGAPLQESQQRQIIRGDQRLRLSWTAARKTIAAIKPKDRIAAPSSDTNRPAGHND